MPESPIGEQIAPSSVNKDCTPSATASPSPPTVYLDNGGDLRLRATANDGHTQDFVVCSRTLVRLSPVFKILLSSGFGESGPAEGEWVVELPSNDFEALLTLLNIIHGRFGMVPKETCLEELYRILYIANKYDMTEAVCPWADSWAKRAEKAQAGGNLVMLAFVAWELGHQELYRKMVQQLVGEFSIDRYDHLITPEGFRLEDYNHIGSLDLLESVGEPRRIFVQSALNLFHNFSKTLLSGSLCLRHHMFCDYVFFGRLYKATYDIRGSLLPESADDIAESVNNFADSIQRIIFSVICTSDHSCRPAPTVIGKVFEALLVSQGVVLTSSHQCYMEKQRQKTRLHDLLHIQEKGRRELR